MSSAKWSRRQVKRATHWKQLVAFGQWPNYAAAFWLRPRGLYYRIRRSWPGPPTPSLASGFVFRLTSRHLLLLSSLPHRSADILSRTSPSSASSPTPLPPISSLDPREIRGRSTSVANDTKQPARSILRLVRLAETGQRRLGRSRRDLFRRVRQ